MQGTVNIYKLAEKLVTGNFHAEAIEALIFCTRAMESHVTFSTPKFLPWRVQLYTMAVQSYMALEAVDQARATLAHGLAGVDELIRTLFLDPVPPKEEVHMEFKAARAAFVALQIKLDATATAPVGGWEQTLQSTWPKDLDKLAVLLDILHSLRQRTVRHAAPSDGVSKVRNCNAHLNHLLSMHVLHVGCCCCHSCWNRIGPRGLEDSTKSVRS